MIDAIATTTNNSEEAIQLYLRWNFRMSVSEKINVRILYKKKKQISPLTDRAKEMLYYLRLNISEEMREAFQWHIRCKLAAMQLQTAHISKKITGDTSQDMLRNELRYRLRIVLGLTFQDINETWTEINRIIEEAFELPLLYHQLQLFWRNTRRHQSYDDDIALRAEWLQQTMGKKMATAFEKRFSGLYPSPRLCLKWMMSSLLPGLVYITRIPKNENSEAWDLIGGDLMDAQYETLFILPDGRTLLEKDQHLGPLTIHDLLRMWDECNENIVITWNDIDKLQ